MKIGIGRRMYASYYSVVLLWLIYGKFSGCGGTG